MTESINTRILRLCVYLQQDKEIQEKFITLVEEVSDWTTLISKAESNALSNLLFHHLKQTDIVVPQESLSTLKALTARHTRNNRERVNALEEILEKFESEGIQSILLKGMSLIHTLYTDNSQRPMGDIDILVKKSVANRAQSALREIGYNAADRKSGFEYDHHHLPMATKKRNGMSIQVEVHHDALSGDVQGSLTFEEAQPRIIPLDLDGYHTHALGHQDQLKHLCHHTFEPCDKIKLGAVADIFGYATKYSNETDWSEQSNAQCMINNTLRCLHFLSPLPSKLDAVLTAPIGDPPTGLGRGFPTLSSTFVKSRSTKEKFKRVFACSEWWLHIFYRVKPEDSLFRVRWLYHPLIIVKWFSRRALAKLKSRIHKR